MKKRLSQNFLYDPSILKRIIQVARVSPEDTVVEIGPGPGRLTVFLAERAKEVVAIELDRALYEALKEKTAQFANITLIHGDALKFNYAGIGPFKVVANIPYHITTPLIFKLIEHRENLISMTLTVQKEVAERIAAGPGGKDYGVLSLSVQYYGRPKLKFIIPKGAFRPVPRVDSACIHIEVYKGPPVNLKDEAFFFRLIRTAFSTRRKTILNALKPLTANGPWEKPAKLLSEAGIDPTRRPETLSMEEFALLANQYRGGS